MITVQLADAFASRWIEAWNSHQVDRILEHYTADIEFHSPFITSLNVNAEGVIRDKDELKRYFQIGLNAYPDLRFTLHHCFLGVDSLVIYYESVNGRMAAEVFQLNSEAKAVKVQCHYTATPMSVLS